MLFGDNSFGQSVFGVPKSTGFEYWNEICKVETFWRKKEPKEILILRCTDENQSN